MPSELLKSRVSTQSILVRFRNKCNRSVDVMWVDYVGLYVNYKTLNPGEYMDIDTYATHPWLFLDSESGDRMHINNNYVFFGDPFVPRILKAQAETGVFPRVSFTVTYPLYDLKTCALLAVRNYIGSAENVDDLDIPKGLKGDLKKTYFKGFAPSTCR